METPGRTPDWPLHLAELCAGLRSPLAPEVRDHARGRLWVLLYDSLTLFLRSQARDFPLSREEIEDIASTKSLELLARAECGSWDPRGRAAGEIASYVATAARNGRIDHARRAGREVPLDGTHERGEGPEMTLVRPMSAADPPAAAVESREFAVAFADCARRLTTRARRVWLFRAYYEMTSREIAAHPDVKLNAGHVDVLVQRARDALRACLSEKGLAPADAPPGAFPALWAELEALREPEAPSHGGAGQ